MSRDPQLSVLVAAILPWLLLDGIGSLLLLLGLLELLGDQPLLTEWTGMADAAWLAVLVGGILAALGMFNLVRTLRTAAAAQRRQAG